MPLLFRVTGVQHRAAAESDLAGVVVASMGDVIGPVAFSSLTLLRKMV